MKNLSLLAPLLPLSLTGRLVFCIWVFSCGLLLLSVSCHVEDAGHPYPGWDLGFRSESITPPLLQKCCFFSPTSFSAFSSVFLCIQFRLLYKRHVLFQQCHKDMLMRIDIWKVPIWAAAIFYWPLFNKTGTIRLHVSEETVFTTLTSVSHVCNGIDIA